MPNHVLSLTTVFRGFLTRVTFLAGLALVCASSPAFAEKNLLPRLPELVIERGFSDAFQVVESTVRAQLVDQTAESRLLVTLRNVSDQTVQSSVKIRILYLTSENAVQISVNGKSARFDRKNPRVPFSLGPSEQITFEVKARQGIEYNLDAIKKEQGMNGSDEENKGKKTKFEVGELTRFFGKENYGRRFLVGPLVSKWGIFPVDFKKVALEIVVPRDFEAVFPHEGLWQKKEHSTSVTYTFDGTEGYTGTIFMPRRDAETFRNLRNAEMNRSTSDSPAVSSASSSPTP
ncbi:MAG: hypothetical protein WA705_04090 [Candidatus Ozemobacteraceae bacterium]